ncbi:MAG TPA: MCE family protein, partial [Xanthobacteraceae bacterium]
IDHILAGAEGLLGTETQPGDIAQAARAIKATAEHLDAHIAEVSTGLARFSNGGLRQWEQLAVDGRRTLAEVDKMVRNIDRNPSRLLFGGSSANDDQPQKKK